MSFKRKIAIAYAVALGVFCVGLVFLIYSGKPAGALDPLHAGMTGKLLDCVTRTPVVKPFTPERGSKLDAGDRAQVLRVYPSFMGTSDPKLLAKRELLFLYASASGAEVGDFNFVYIVVEEEADKRYCATQVLRGPYEFNRTFFEKYIGYK